VNGVAGADPLASREGPEVTRTGSGPKRVLIVEDEDAVASLYRRALATSNCVLYRARDGEEAISLVETTSFDVIVSDLTLPGLGGEELLRSLRERDRHVPIVIVTGKPEIESAITAVECHALRYLLKPIGPKELMDAVKTAMESRTSSLPSVGGLDRPTRRAIPNGEQFLRLLGSLFIEYQAVVRPLEGLVLGYEASARTKRARFYSPSALFSVARELDSVKALSRRVRGAIAAGLGTLPKEALVFVSLQADELEDGGLYSRSNPLLSFTGRIVVGLADDARVDGLEDRIHALRSRGLLFALDLGSGYDALTKLIQLEPDFARIDVSLVQDIDKCTPKRMLVSSLVTACRQLRIQLICQDVETEAEGSCLLELGAELLQGAFFCPPKPSFDREDGERLARRIEELNRGQKHWNK